jgi:tRNA threonylcarbamoyladenosine biosynthesis protein TsaB
LHGFAGIKRLRFRREVQPIPALKTPLGFLPLLDPLSSIFDPLKFHPSRPVQRIRGLTPPGSPMLTLAIETSGPLGSVALFESGALLAEQSLELGRQHGQSLIPTIRDLLVSCGTLPRNLGAVAVSIGPGSYTGLRVGVVCAKTLAYAANCQLVAVDTLHAVACNSPADITTVEVICDAQRGDLFSGKYARDASSQWIPEHETRQIPVDAWAHEVKSTDTVSGPGLDKFAHLVAGRCRVLSADFRRPLATWVGRLGIEKLKSGQAADLWSIEPLYLRRSSAETQWEKLHPGT